METYYGLVRTPWDAIVLFEACRIGMLPRVQRRLSEKERHSIRSGSVFVWDEREAGMRRWTDGKSWSASRVSGSFLTYREMVGGKQKEPQKDQAASSSSSSGYDGSEHTESATEGYVYKPDGLMKQSFSITTSTNLKLHLISYYTRQHYNSTDLPVPTQDPHLKGIRVPKGLYPDSSTPIEHNHLHHHHMQMSGARLPPPPPPPPPSSQQRGQASPQPMQYPPFAQQFSQYQNPYMAPPAQLFNTLQPPPPPPSSASSHLPTPPASAPAPGAQPTTQPHYRHPTHRRVQPPAPPPPATQHLHQHQHQHQHQRHRASSSPHQPAHHQRAPRISPSASPSSAAQLQHTSTHTRSSSATEPSTTPTILPPPQLTQSAQSLNVHEVPYDKGASFDEDTRAKQSLDRRFIM